MWCIVQISRVTAQYCQIIIPVENAPTLEHTTPEPHVFYLSAGLVRLVLLPVEGKATNYVAYPIFSGVCHYWPSSETMFLPEVNGNPEEAGGLAFAKGGNPLLPPYRSTCANTWLSTTT